MKKNIVIGLLVVTTLLSLMYGFTQKAEADKQRALAESNKKLAEEQLRRLQISLEESRRAKSDALKLIK